MTFKGILLCMTLIAANPVWARENTDVIVMKNGDRITCEIKGLRFNTLYISVPYILGTLSVDWARVDHLKSNQLFLVRTQNGTVYTGAISTPETAGGRPVQIDVLETSQRKVTLDRAQVVNVNETSTRFWQRLNGRIGAGLTYSKGNNATQYNLTSDVNYPRERWAFQGAYSSNFTSNIGAPTSTRNDFSFSAQRLMRWNNWYYTGITDFLESSAQGIRWQSTFGGGVGRILKNTGGTSFTLYGGLGWQRINYREAIVPAGTRQVTSGLIGSSLKIFRFDRTTLTVSARLLPAISERGRVHFALDSSYDVKLWGKLDWNFTFYGNWDNHPPPGFSGSDYGTSTGLSVSFGNR
jgi:Protein of unknown function, DUF481